MPRRSTAYRLDKLVGDAVRDLDGFAGQKPISKKRKKTKKRKDQAKVPQHAKTKMRLLNERIVDLHKELTLHKQITLWAKKVVEAETETQLHNGIRKLRDVLESKGAYEDGPGRLAKRISTTSGNARKSMVPGVRVKDWETGEGPEVQKRALRMESPAPSAEPAETFDAAAEDALKAWDWL